MRVCLSVLLLALATHAMAWWGTPFAGSPYAGSYWPNAWPGYAPGYNYGPHNYGGGYGRGYNYGPYGYPGNSNGSDWNVRGYMTEWGDMHFVIEYRGNINNDLFGNQYGYPGYRGYGMPYYGSGWR